MVYDTAMERNHYVNENGHLRVLKLSHLPETVSRSFGFRDLFHVGLTQPSKSHTFMPMCT